MRISYWSSDVCSSDLQRRLRLFQILIEQDRVIEARHRIAGRHLQPLLVGESGALIVAGLAIEDAKPVELVHIVRIISAEHRSGTVCVSTFRSRCSPYHYK